MEGYHVVWSGRFRTSHQPPFSVFHLEPVEIQRRVSCHRARIPLGERKFRSLLMSAE
jgi:hypothetical protein